MMDMYEQIIMLLKSQNILLAKVKKALVYNGIIVTLILILFIAFFIFYALTL